METGPACEPAERHNDLPAVPVVGSFPRHQQNAQKWGCCALGMGRVNIGPGVSQGIRLGHLSQKDEQRSFVLSDAVPGRLDI